MTSDLHPTVQWLYAAECDGGGISAWNDNGTWHKPYPEVTGYLLPTLIHWGAGDLATRCADWLLEIQSRDGSWPGLDGVPRPFDTSAIIEGLLFMYEATVDNRYYNAAAVATEWMYSQVHRGGFLRNSPFNPSPEIYNLRASAIIENEAELDYWKTSPIMGERERTHYLAYALEGAQRLGGERWAQKYIELSYHSGNVLQPFHVDRSWRAVDGVYDICASAQMAILFHCYGLDVSRHYEAIKRRVDPNGGVPQSTADARQIAWGAKFYLDLAKIMEG